MIWNQRFDVIVAKWSRRFGISVPGVIVATVQVEPRCGGHVTDRLDGMIPSCVSVCAISQCHPRISSSIDVSAAIHVYVFLTPSVAVGGLVFWG